MYNLLIEIGVIGWLSAVILAINLYNNVKGGKKQKAELDRERTEVKEEREKDREQFLTIIKSQQELLQNYSLSFTEVLKEHSGLNEDARRTMRHLEQTFELQMKAIKTDMENIDNKVNSINKDINKIYQKIH